MTLSPDGGLVLRERQRKRERQRGIEREGQRKEGDVATSHVTTVSHVLCRHTYKNMQRKCKIDHDLT